MPMMPPSAQKLAHPDGELATAAAATKAGLGFGLSTLSTTTLEEVASACQPGVPKLFQLYVLKDRALAASLVRRAEAAGYNVRLPPGHQHKQMLNKCCTEVRKHTHTPNK